MRLTRRGTVVTGLGALLLAVGWWGRYPLFGVLGAGLLGAVLAAVLLTRHGVRVAVRRSVHPDRVTRGRPALATLRVTNPGPRRQAPFLATDRAGPGDRTVPVPALPPGATVVRHYELPTGTRGVWPVGPLALDRRDAFGLARSRRSAGPAATLWVHPRQHPARTPRAGRRGCLELTDVREYVPGDEVRLLHWKATAHTGQLMVRDLSDPYRGRFTVLLDTRPQAAPADRFEQMVEVAASLLTASVRAGRQTALVTGTGRTTVVDGGPDAARRLLDALSEVSRDAGAPVPPGGAAGGPVPPGRTGGDLVLIAGGGPPAVPAAWLRRHFDPVLVLAMAGPVDLPGLPALPAETAEQAVRRWNEYPR